MGKSIQFQGIESLITGYKNTGAKGWSVWDGRDMLTKGIGVELLEKFLEALEEGSTNTIYTLKIYEDIDDAKKIKMGTDPDGSFKFLLNGDADQVTSSLYSQGNNSNRLFQRLEKLEEISAKQTELLLKIGNTDDDEQEEAEPETIGSVFMDLMKNPSKIKELGESLVMVKSLLVNPSNNLAPIPAQIGAVNDQLGAVSNEEYIQRCQNAVSKLERNDPKFIIHIEKLAQISESDKTLFNTLTSMLDKM